MSDAPIFKTKYPGRCTLCRRSFSVGDYIRASAVSGYEHAGRDVVGEDTCDPFGISDQDPEPDFTQD
jgi:hypothetical protein